MSSPQVMASAANISASGKVLPHSVLPLHPSMGHSEPHFSLLAQPGVALAVENRASHFQHHLRPLPPMQGRVTEASADLGAQEGMCCRTITVVLEPAWPRSALWLPGSCLLLRFGWRHHLGESGWAYTWAACTAATPPPVALSAALALWIPETEQGVELRLPCMKSSGCGLLPAWVSVVGH